MSNYVGKEAELLDPSSDDECARFDFTSDCPSLEPCKLHDCTENECKCPVAGRYVRKEDQK